MLPTKSKICEQNSIMAGEPSRGPNQARDEILPETQASQRAIGSRPQVRHTQASKSLPMGVRSRAGQSKPLSSRPTFNRGKNYFPNETEWLLGAISEYLPIGNMEWGSVLKRHNERYLWTTRDVPSLKRKFANLYNANSPSSNFNPHPHITRVKDLLWRIKVRADAGDDEIGDLGLGEDMLQLALVDDGDVEACETPEQTPFDVDGNGNGTQNTVPRALELDTDYEPRLPSRPVIRKRASRKDHEGSCEHKWNMKPRDSRQRGRSAGLSPNDENTLSCARRTDMRRKAEESRREAEAQCHLDMMELTRTRDEQVELDHRERRERDERRHEQFMQMMLTLHGGKGKYM